MKLHSLSVRVAALLLVLPGCGLPFDETPELNANTCSAAADCGSEGACVATQDGEARCVATSADLGSVIIEVRPIGGDASIVFADAVNVVGDSGKGLLHNLDLALPASIQISGTIPAPELLPSTCTADDGTLPVDVTLIRQVTYGPFASRFELPSTVTSSSDATAAFSIAVPPGKYDLYLRPRALTEECALQLPPPQLVKDFVVDENTPAFAPDGMAAVNELSGSIIAPVPADSLDGWVLEVLDPTYGFVISNQFLLTEPETPPLEIEGFFYHDTTDAILRLRNPEGNLSVHWALDALDLNSDQVVELDLADLVSEPLPTPFTARVVDSTGAFVPSANVTIQSLALTGSTMQNANYRIQTIADETGTVTVELVPGTYSVTIIPDVLGDATYFGEWEITAELEPFGKTFELVVQPVLNGVVTDPTGAALVSAPITVVPSQSVANSYFTRALVDPEPLKRQFFATANGDGSFELSVDPGEIDLAVQMAAETGYPWSVLPSFKVDEAKLKPLLDVGEMQVRYPVMLQGHVSDAGMSLPYAQVRAWVVGASETGDGPLIQIGAAITDANGAYMLPLPPGITIVDSQPADSAE